MLQTRLIISRWCARLTECFLNNALFLAWLTSIKTPPNWYAACQSLAMSQKHIRFSDAELCREFKTVLSDVEKFSPSCRAQQGYHGVGYSTGGEGRGRSQATAAVRVVGGGFRPAVNAGSENWNPMGGR